MAGTAGRQIGGDFGHTSVLPIKAEKLTRGLKNRNSWEWLDRSGQRHRSQVSEQLGRLENILHMATTLNEVQAASWRFFRKLPMRPTRPEI